METPKKEAMAMPTLFGRKEKAEEADKAVPLEDDQKEELEEDVSLLQKEDKASVRKVISEVKETIKEATRASLRDVKLLEEGRCPNCGRKTRQFLFTTVCEYCGWSSFITPKRGHVTIHLRNGGTIESHTVFRTIQGDVLGITDDVVRVRVPQDNIGYIEYIWTDDEIAERREQLRRERLVVCDWCGREVQWDEYVAVTYVAFGKEQQKFVFCSEKCKQAFQKQYPTRIHRNCYERPCEGCNECIKRYPDEETWEKLEEKPARPEDKK
ncbi:MAG: hypothetical protein DRQ08_07795 [Candidatus Latescibacterota bacterium]|nr:MAG: hypothetical protein DRQ08_07795 [Candidatus Latescibacterota bacterium]